MDLTHVLLVLLDQSFRLLHLLLASLRWHHSLQRDAVIYSHGHLFSVPLSVLELASSEDKTGELRVFPIPLCTTWL